MVEITENVVKHAIEANIQYIVKLSSYGVDSKSQSRISQWHRQAEKIIENSGIDFTFLRPINFMQNVIYQFGEMIKNEGGIFLPCGDGKISFVDVRDIACVAVEVLTSKGHKGKSYNITGSEALSYHQVADILSELTGKTVVYRDISEDLAREKLKEMGQPDEVIEAAMTSFKTVKEGYRSKVFLTIKEITGRKPISFREFVTDFADAFINLFLLLTSVSAALSAFIFHIVAYFFYNFK